MGNREYKDVRTLFGCDRGEVLDVRMKKGSNYDYEPGVVLFKVTKGDMMVESGEFNRDGILNPMHVWVEDWTDYTVNGYKVYNAVNFDTETGEWEAFSDKKLKVGYSLYMPNGVGMGGGTWEYKGDYVQWFRDKKLGDVLGGGCGGS